MYFGKMSLADHSQPRGIRGISEIQVDSQEIQEAHDELSERSESAKT